jgi:hypothetical protein
MSLTPSRKLLKDMVHFAKTNEGVPKVKRFMERYKPQLRENILYLGKKVFIPSESAIAVLNKVGKNGMPLRTQKIAQQWIKERFVGITNKKVAEFVNMYRIYQKKMLRRDENINRHKISDVMLAQITKALHGKKVSNKINKFITKFPGLKLKKDKVFLNEKRVLSTEELPQILNDELTAGECPLGIDSCYSFLHTKYCGSLTRRNVSAFIKSLESWQLNRTRPPNPDRVKATYTQHREGVTRFLLSKKRGGSWNHLTGDLMYIPKQWSKYKYFLCVVHVRSSYCWFESISERHPKDLIAPMKTILTEAESKFGKVEFFSSDKGSEFLGEFAAFLRARGIKVQNGHKSYHAERKIGQFGRAFGQLFGIGVKFEKALALTVRKLNNVKSRVYGKTPVSVGTHDKLKKPRILKKGRRKQNPFKQFAIGQRVRYLKKNAEITNVMYKSYGGTSRKTKHENWSKITPEIIDKKNNLGIWKYKLSSDEKWRKGYELQQIDEVRKLVVKKKSPIKLPGLQKKIAKIKEKMPKVRKDKIIKALESSRGFGESGTYWAPVSGKRRSSRRKKIKYTEIDLT